MHAKLLLVASLAGGVGGTVACVVLLASATLGGRGSAVALAIAMVGALTAALAATSRLRQSLVQPVAEMVQAGRWALDYHDYSMRVTKRSDDELGLLCDVVNRLAAELQRAEAVAERGHRDFESALADRALELAGTKAQLEHEKAERRRGEHELEQLRGELNHSARTAGMAQIATGVLDDVAHVLGSIQVSAELAGGRIRQSKITELARAVEAIGDRPNVGDYLAHDPQGVELPGLLALLVAHLADERADVLAELELLARRASHVRAVVATQQSYAAGEESLSISHRTPMADGGPGRLRAA